MMMGFAVIPLTLAIGFGVDYSRAERLQTQLNAIADSSALAAVTPTMLCQSSANAQAAATAMFNTQAATLQGISGTITPSVTINPASSAAGCAGSLRTATVTYTANVKTVISGIMGVKTLAIGGSAIANASQPPSINFYIAMDTSPSMLLPTTSTGITNLNNGVIWNGAGAFGYPVVGCDFACHSINSHTWNYGNFVKDANNNAIYTTTFDPASVTATNTYRIQCTNVAAHGSIPATYAGYVYDGNNNQIGTNGSITNGGGSTACGGNYWNNNGGNLVSNSVNLQYYQTSTASWQNVTVNFPDSWWLAENYAALNPGQSNIQLRLDAETPAAQNLTTYAYNIEQNYASAPTPPVYKLQFFTFAYGAPAVVPTAPWGTLTDVATSHTSTFPSMTANAPLQNGVGCWTATSGVCPGNGFSDFSALLSGMQSTMPATSGLGTPSNPQSVLIILTDGAQDVIAAGQFGALLPSQIAQCNAIKATGTKIAILYTTYDPNTVNYTARPDFNEFAVGSSPFSGTGIPNIASQLQACSTQNPDGSYLMQTVSTNGDISSALNQLFSMAVQSARLVQ